ncbi:MAG: hypothetical protein P8Y47_08040 [Alphaproteobacteria bacterium]
MPDMKKVVNTFDDLVDKIARDDNISKEDAMIKARRRAPEIFKALRNGGHSKELHMKAASQHRVGNPSNSRSANLPVAAALKQKFDEAIAAIRQETGCDLHAAYRILRERDPNLHAAFRNA